MHNKSLSLVLGSIAGALTLSACNLDIPDLNNPGLNQIEDTPTVSSINTATTGLLVGFRAGKAPTVGFVNLLGILGREAYDFDAADPRFVSEVVQSNLNKSSPFGGSFWGGPYANIRQANIILHGVEKVAEYSDAQRAGIQGFAHTIIALELLTVIVTHAETGAVIDTDRPIDGPLGPFVSQAEVYAEIGRLLDQAKDELAAAGSAFSFPLSPGYTGFNTPATFLTFNRAVRARVDVYTKKYQDALAHLAESFLVDDTAKMGFAFTTGVSHSYSLNTGDVTNALINANIYAHPSLETDAQKQANGMPDARYTAKVQTMLNDKKEVVTASAANDMFMKTTRKFKIYTNVTSIPVIRNEELILLKAEALWFSGDKTGALTELNIVRTNSGKLPAITDAPASDTAFVDLLLYERRYSLMYEGGHRWIDLRRFGREIPVDGPAHIRNLRFPVPQAECDARGSEAACSITSSDPAK